MELREFIKDAKKEIIILGTNAIIQELSRSHKLFAEILESNEDLKLTILYESDYENFNSSLFTDNDYVKTRITYDTLALYRNRLFGSNKKSRYGLLESIISEVKDSSKIESIKDRVFTKQLNLRKSFNMIKADNKMWISLLTLSTTTYTPVEENNPMYQEIENYLGFLLSDKHGGVYLSDPGDELIELYDNSALPRGIMPRRAFNDNNFQKYTIWGFVFNRKGELLIHQRSRYTADNRLLWDKSIGGHVDLTDSSTIITAKRELTEELYLPNAEYTKYVTVDLGDIVDFGEWDVEKKPENSFKSQFGSLDKYDWILFRATDSTRREPLTMNRVSKRIITKGDEKTIVSNRTMSDVYLFISPENYLTDHEQMKDMLSPVEKTGAAEDHKLISIPDLDEWIRKETENGTEKEVFTDDMIYLMREYKGLFEQFADSIKYIFDNN